MSRAGTERAPALDAQQSTKPSVEVSTLEGEPQHAGLENADFGSEPFADFLPAVPDKEEPSRPAPLPSKSQAQPLAPSRWPSIRSGFLWFGVGLLSTWQALAMFSPSARATTPATTTSAGAVATPPERDTNEPAKVVNSNQAAQSPLPEQSDSNKALEHVPPKVVQDKASSAVSKRSAPLQRSTSSVPSSPRTNKTKPETERAPLKAERRSSLSLERNNPWQD